MKKIINKKILELKIPKDYKDFDNLVCPKCKKKEVYNYLCSYVRPVGAYSVGDWVCLNCRAVFGKEKPK